jgi:hypothetical protein
MWVHYGMQHTALFSCTHIPNIIDLSRKKQLFDLEVKVQTKVILVRDTPLMHHIPNIIDLSRKTKNVMAQTRIYYCPDHNIFVLR